MKDYTSLFRIRTVTCFVSLRPESLVVYDDTDKIEWKESPMEEAVALLRTVESALTTAGYTVQTVRLVTNPFGEWLPVADVSQTTTVLRCLDQWLGDHGIDFCSLGPAQSAQEAREICPLIVQKSSRFSCSAILTATNVSMAQACAATIRQIAHTTEPADFMQDGLGNFRFCVAACCPPIIPFFPVAKAPSNQQGLIFAIGLENGSLTQHLLAECQSLAKVPTIFRQGMTEAIRPVQEIALAHEIIDKITFAGIDTSLNPSLEATGSVAAALESLAEVTSWGGPGTLAVAAAITKSLQSLPGIRRTGYCGIMLPVCEDARLAELTETEQLRLADLLSVSSVCGVGIDTVPLPGDVTESALASLVLDVAGLADRWQKPLSCRVFPLPGKRFGERTTFNFPHMMNAALLPIEVTSSISEGSKRSRAENLYASDSPKKQKTTDSVPEYGSQSYWEDRYRDDSLAMHEWYFTYKDLRPLVLPLIFGTDLPECLQTAELTESVAMSSAGSAEQVVKADHKLDGSVPAQDEMSPENEIDHADDEYEEEEVLSDDESSNAGSAVREGLFKSGLISVVEIGCGDVPLGAGLASDAELYEKTTGTAAIQKILCTDYSETVVATIKTKFQEHGKLLDFATADARKLPYPNRSFHLVLEKGTLDAMLSDKEHGTTNCVKILSECARILAIHGYILLVSHLNANTESGVAWLSDVVFEGLRQGDAKSAWLVECHGNEEGAAVYIIQKKPKVLEDASTDDTIPVQFFSYT